jgi:HAD superfamily hydrolase (TIGR01549 family)
LDHAGNSGGVGFSEGARENADMIEAVVFDVGECLVDETREYGTWADWLDVPRHTFAATFGAVIAQGRDYRDTFQVFSPGFDLTAERAKRAAAGQPENFGEEDLYPDVCPALSALRDAGYWVGIAGNQTVRAGTILRGLDLPADLITTSDDLGVAKPDVRFFAEVEGVTPVPADRTLYVGDRLDNDIRPAAAHGLHTALIRRGPWGIIQRHEPDADRVPTMRIDRLTELPARIAALNRAAC